MADTINLEILEDGTVRISTDKISAGNHRQADEVLAAIDALLAGAVETKHKHGHTHNHTHTHNHVKH